jgi:surface polysaccharide O-acyltransferase-like enzyme
VEFYSLGIALLLYFAFPGVFGVGEIVKSAFPVLFERYWYFTAYFLMFFMTPFMKRFVLETSKQSIMKFFAALFILLSVLPTVVDKDVFYTMNGYSALWLMIMYILGASIRHFGLWQNKKNGFYLAVFASAVACNIVAKYVLAYISIRLTGVESVHTNVLIEYTAPTIIVASVMLLLLFSKFNMNSVAVAFTKFFAPMTFGVYLIHMQPMLWALFGESPFSYIADFPLYKAALLFVAIITTVYLSCSMLEWGRRLLFSLCRVSVVEEWVAKRAYSLWNRIVP